MSRYVELDQYSREQRFRLFRKIILVSFCGVILLAPLALLEFTLTPREVVGIVVAPHGEPTEFGLRRYLIVRLDDGQMIRALISGDVHFKKDRRAVVKETTTMFFGYKRYEFLRYSDQTGEQSVRRTS